MQEKYLVQNTYENLKLSFQFYSRLLNYAFEELYKLEDFQKVENLRKLIKADIYILNNGLRKLDFYVQHIEDDNGLNNGKFFNLYDFIDLLISYDEVYKTNAGKVTKYFKSLRAEASLEAIHFYNIIGTCRNKLFTNYESILILQTKAKGVDNSDREKSVTNINEASGLKHIYTGMFKDKELIEFDNIYSRQKELIESRKHIETKFKYYISCLFKFSDDYIDSRIIETINLKRTAKIITIQEDLLKNHSHKNNDFNLDKLKNNFAKTEYFEFNEYLDMLIILGFKDSILDFDSNKEFEVFNNDRELKDSYKHLQDTCQELDYLFHDLLEANKKYLTNEFVLDNGHFPVISY